MEMLQLTENRYSGIPTVRSVMSAAHQKEPLFLDERGSFSVTLYNKADDAGMPPAAEQELLAFLKTPRSRKEIAQYLGITMTTYTKQARIGPLAERRLAIRSMPEKPGSKLQKFISR